MLDDSGTFSGGAAKEIEEETGLKIAENELTDLTSLAIPPSSQKEECLRQAIYPSAGGCDEFVPIFLWQKRVPRDTLKEWQGKLTGLREQNEKITLMLSPLEQLWKFGGRDAKALAGYALYQGLRSEGQI